MKQLKYKKTTLISTFVIVMVLTGYTIYYATSSSKNSTQKQYHISSVLGGVCTLDLGKSMCGDFEVHLESESGIKEVYFVEGWGEHGQDRKHSEYLLDKLHKAQESNQQLMITTNNTYIIDIQ